MLFTFDDGPGGTLTENVLATLKAHDVRAVFFLVGTRVRLGTRARVPAIVDRILAEGHAIGNHTTSHKDLCLRENAALIASEIDSAASAITAVAGMNMVLFRAPFGVRCPQLEDALATRGVHHMHWDIDPQEWRTQDAAYTQAVITGKIGRMHDDERVVILGHDTNPTTVTALPVILEWIRAENVRRKAAGRKTIRILGPSEIASEQLAAPLRSILASIELGAGVAELEQRFVAPLTAPRAQAGVPSH